MRILFFFPVEEPFILPYVVSRTVPHAQAARFSFKVSASICNLALRAAALAREEEVIEFVETVDPF